MSKLYIVDIFLIELWVITLNDLVSRHFAFDLVVSQGKALARMQILMRVLAYSQYAHQLQYNEALATSLGP